MSIKKSDTLQSPGIHVFLVAAAVVLLYPVISGSASFCVNPDNLHQAFPFFEKLASSLHKGYLPVWDAGTYGGKNFSGEFQTGIFYPLNILVCWLYGSTSGIDVYYLDLLVAFHYLICVIGMYHLGRALKLSGSAAVVSALVFSFTGVISSRSGAQTCIFCGLVWIPWVLFSVVRYYTQAPRKRYLVYAGIFGGLEILAGHIQPFYHSILLSLILVIYYEYQQGAGWLPLLRSVIINMVIIGAVPILVAFPQVYYALQYLHNCYRWVNADNPIGPGQKVPYAVYALKNIVQLRDLPSLLDKSYSSPEDDNVIYMGILPLLLLIFFWVKTKALSMAPYHVRLHRLLTGIFLAGSVIMLGYFSFVCPLIYKLPFVPSIRELGRYGVLVNISGALLVGLAITYLAELRQVLFPRGRTFFWYVLLACLLNVFYLSFLQFEHSFPLGVTLPWLLALLFFVLMPYIRQTQVLRLLVIAFLLVDLFFNKCNFGSTQLSSYPPKYYGRNRIIDTLEATYGKYRVSIEFENEDLARRNLGDVYAIQTKSGYGATMNKPYYDFLSVDWSMGGQVNDLLNIKYIITDKVLDSNFIFVDSVQHQHLYERKNYYPRYYWKSQLGMPGAQIEKANASTIKQLAYGDLSQELVVNCTQADTLILSENFYPGWHCTDNGKEIPIYEPTIGNYPRIFRSVALDKGQHQLRFAYNKVFHWF
jgi:hypothetical protein